MSEASVDRAEYLRVPEKTVSASDATLLARWGQAAGDTAQSTPLTNEAAASAEAGRQLALMGDVTAEDQVLIEGIHRDLEGETVAIDYTHPDGGTYFGGDASVLILVTKARVDPNAGTTRLQGIIGV